MRNGDGGGGAYSFAACLSHLTIDHTHPFRDGAMRGYTHVMHGHGRMTIDPHREGAKSETSVGELVASTKTERKIKKPA